MIYYFFVVFSVIWTTKLKGLFIFLSFTSQPCFLCSDLCQWNHFLLWYLSFCKPRRNVFSLAINCFRRFLRTPSVTNARFLIFHSFRCFTLSIATRLSSFPFSISVVPFGLWILNSLPFRFALTLFIKPGIRFQLGLTCIMRFEYRCMCFCYGIWVFAGQQDKRLDLCSFYH